MQGKQHNPNDETRGAVHLMTSRGATQSMAADALGIEEKCLRRHYRGELDGGAVVQADMAVAEQPVPHRDRRRARRRHRGDLLAQDPGWLARSRSRRRGGCGSADHDPVGDSGG